MFTVTLLLQRTSLYPVVTQDTQLIITRAGLAKTASAADAGNATYSYSLPLGAIFGIWLTINKSFTIFDQVLQNIVDVFVESGYAVSLKWKNVERDFESKVNYTYRNRTNVPYKIDNSRERKDRNYSNFLGFKV